MYQRRWFSVAACAVGVLAALWTAAAHAQASRMMTFDKPSGEIFFALSVSPPAAAPLPAVDAIVLFDTSASQTGLYRDDALTALRSLLAGLGPNDRVHLAAVDLAAAPLTNGLVSPGSAEMEQGLAKLRQRTPLGSTDMGAALKYAVDQLAGSNRPKVVLYIGDGVSKAGLLQPAALGDAVAELTRARAAVSSLAIGPDRDIALLAAIANHTGGNLYIDSNEQSPQQAGMALAEMAHAPVVWPTSFSAPDAVAELYPAAMPPLRGDRDTIVIGRLHDRAAGQWKLVGDAAGQPREIAWNVTPEATHEDGGFLPQLVEQVRPTRGIGLPTLGSAGLHEVSRLMAADAAALTKLGAQAAASGNTAGAQALVDRALAVDPNNPQALAVRNAVQNKAVDTGRGVAGEPELRLTNAQLEGAGGAAAGRGGDGSLLEMFEAGAGRLLLERENLREVEQGIIRTEVEKSLKEARDRMSIEPEAAKQDLARVRDMVERSTALDAEGRAQLIGQIVQAQQQASQRSIVLEKERAEANAKLGAQLERQRLLDDLARNREKVQQLMVKFETLMAEGRYRQAEEEIATEVLALEPSPTAVSAQLGSRTLRYFNDAKYVQEMRQRNYVDAMFQVELSSIPFPDEPPIVYPDTEVWRELTIRRKEKYSSVDLASTGGSEKRIFSELEKTTELSFIETPLQDVVTLLSDKHNIPILLDRAALDGVGVGTDTPVTINLKGVTLRSALRLMLKEKELTYVVRDEVLLITTPEEAESKLVTKVYPVADLVLPISSGAGANPFMLGGGLGGQGGFGGGLGGGGMGGGGFGGGGFGGQGGFGGGGFGGQGGFLAVDDELRLGGGQSDAPREEAAAPAAPFRPQVKRPARYDLPEAIRVTPAPGQSLTDAWDAYFSNYQAGAADAQVAHNAQIRETVRQAMRRQRYDEVSAVVSSALKHGWPQPWMYEALGLALQAKYAAAGQTPPADELERTLMSAVDFSRTSDELLFAATYMGQMGLHSRALSLYRTVSDLEPHRAEPYLHGLRLARDSGDLDAIRWATLGVLRQAWGKEQRHIEGSAALLARETLVRLQQEGRQAEAAAYDQQLRQALVRDCIIKVTWTGDADIDLLVQEPAGTVCSLAESRTTSGGVLLGDAFSAAGQTPTEGYSEMYICPEGFAGEYRLLVKRVWGRPTAGKVTIDIYTGYGTPDERHIRQQAPIGEKDALVVFDVPSGRRAEPLELRQAANVAVAQLNVNRAVLLQQLGTLEESQAVRALERDRRVQQQLLAGQRRGVGYMPVITTLPEGTNMTATAVISADRRYVRITAVPLFSAIGDVTTFNFATGAQGGAGGAGGAAGVP